MRVYLYILLLSCFLLFENKSVKAETKGFTILGQFTELPTYRGVHLYLYSLIGRDKVLVDSIPLNHEGGFFKRLSTKLPTGLYEVSLNNTLFATVIIGENEDQLKLEASYLQWQTGYLRPGSSNENEALKLLRELVAHRNGQINRITGEIQQADITHPEFRSKIDSLHSEKEQIYSIYNTQLKRIVRAYGRTFAAQQIFPFYLEPVMADIDSASFKFDNQRAFLHRYYFHYLDLNNPDIIETPLFESRVISYLDQYTHHTRSGFMNSLEHLLQQANEREEVRKEIYAIFKDYLKSNGYFDIWKHIKTTHKGVMAYIQQE